MADAAIADHGGQPSAPPQTAAKERSAGVKLVIAAAIATALMIPLLMVYGLVWDRQQQAETAQSAIGQGWGGSQTISPPVLVIPYRSAENETTQENGRDVTRSVTRVRELFLSPVRNQTTVQLKPERRRKAIYESVVYEAAITGEARFALPADLARYGVARDTLQLDRAEVRLGVSDARGLVAGNRLDVNGRATELQPGKGTLATGNSGTFAFINWTDGTPLVAQYQLGVRGLGDFRLVARGVSTQFDVASSWPNPSFSGDFLPTRRTVADNGFTARYAISNLALGQAQVLTSDIGPPRANSADTDAFMREAGDAANSGNAKAITISLIEPVDLYSQVNRAIKYGFLFVGFTFVAFLMFDIIGGARVAAAEYLLAGMALVLFFVMLLAFAELIGFLLAYALAAGAIVGLLSAYSAAVLKSWQRARFLAALLIGLYALLYTLLNLEAYSLLIGSVLMFAALAGVMYLTRNIDWNAASREKSVPVPVLGG